MMRKLNVTSRVELLNQIGIDRSSFPDNDENGSHLSFRDGRHPVLTFPT